jgi:hypothetical protein
VPAKTGAAVTSPRLTTSTRANKILSIFFTLHLLRYSSIFPKSLSLDRASAGAQMNAGQDFSFFFRRHGLPRLCLAMTSGFEREGGFCRDRKKEPGSHVYVCSAEHRGNYRNSLAHTLDHQPYIRLVIVMVPLYYMVQLLNFH